MFTTKCWGLHLYARRYVWNNMKFMYQLDCTMQYFLVLCYSIPKLGQGSDNM